MMGLSKQLARLKHRLKKDHRMKPIISKEVNLKRFRFSVLFSILFALTVASAQSTSAAKGLTENPVFQKDCAKCHGKTAEGRHFGGPSLLSEKTAAMTSDDLTNIIKNGKGHMPKFGSKLQSEEIDTLVQQIKAAHQ